MYNGTFIRLFRHWVNLAKFRRVPLLSIITFSVPYCITGLYYVYYTELFFSPCYRSQYETSFFEEGISFAIISPCKAIGQLVPTLIFSNFETCIYYYHISSNSFGLFCQYLFHFIFLKINRDKNDQQG